MRFSREEKREMVEDILKRRKTINAVSVESGIDCRKLKRLVTRAREQGLDEVFRRREYHTYPDSFKVAAIESVISGNSYGKVANELGISYALVRNWHKKYSESGIGSVTEARRGRPLKKKDETHNEADVAAIEGLRKALKEKDRQLERAMIENEFLKKLDALVRERIEREDGRSSR